MSVTTDENTRGRARSEISKSIKNEFERFHIYNSLGEYSDTNIYEREGSNVTGGTLRKLAIDNAERFGMTRGEVEDDYHIGMMANMQAIIFDVADEAYGNMYDEARLNGATKEGAHRSALKNTEHVLSYYFRDFQKLKNIEDTNERKKVRLLATGRLMDQLIDYDEKDGYAYTNVKELRNAFTYHNIQTPIIKKDGTVTNKFISPFPKDRVRPNTTKDLDMDKPGMFLLPVMETTLLGGAISLAIDGSVDDSWLETIAARREFEREHYSGWYAARDMIAPITEMAVYSYASGGAAAAFMPSIITAQQLTGSLVEAGGSASKQYLRSNKLQDSHYGQFAGEAAFTFGTALAAGYVGKGIQALGESIAPTARLGITKYIGNKVKLLSPITNVLNKGPLANSVRHLTKSAAIRVADTTSDLMIDKMVLKGGRFVFGDQQFVTDATINYLDNFTMTPSNEQEWRAFANIFGRKVAGSFLSQGLQIKKHKESGEDRWLYKQFDTETSDSKMINKTANFVNWVNETLFPRSNWTSVDNILKSRGSSLEEKVRNADFDIADTFRMQLHSELAQTVLFNKNILGIKKVFDIDRLVNDPVRKYVADVARNDALRQAVKIRNEDLSTVGNIAAKRLFKALSQEGAISKKSDQVLVDDPSVIYAGKARDNTDQHIVVDGKRASNVVLRELKMMQQGLDLDGPTFKKLIRHINANLQSNDIYVDSPLKLDIDDKKDLGTAVSKVISDAIKNNKSGTLNNVKIAGYEEDFRQSYKEFNQKKYDRLTEGKIEKYSKEDLDNELNETVRQFAKLKNPFKYKGEISFWRNIYNIGRYIAKKTIVDPHKKVTDYLLDPKPKHKAMFDKLVEDSKDLANKASISGSDISPADARRILGVSAAKMVEEHHDYMRRAVQRHKDGKLTDEARDDILKTNIEQINVLARTFGEYVAEPLQKFKMELSDKAEVTGTTDLKKALVDMQKTGKIFNNDMDEYLIQLTGRLKNDPKPDHIAPEVLYNHLINNSRKAVDNRALLESLADQGVRDEVNLSVISDAIRLMGNVKDEDYSKQSVAIKKLLSRSSLTLPIGNGKISVQTEGGEPVKLDQADFENIKTTLADIISSDPTKIKNDIDDTDVQKAVVFALAKAYSYETSDGTNRRKRLIEDLVRHNVIDDTKGVELSFNAEKPEAIIKLKHKVNPISEWGTRKITVGEENTTIKANEAKRSTALELMKVIGYGERVNYTNEYYIKTLKESKQIDLDISKLADTNIASTNSLLDLTFKEQKMEFMKSFRDLGISYDEVMDIVFRSSSNTDDVEVGVEKMLRMYAPAEMSKLTVGGLDSFIRLSAMEASQKYNTSLEYNDESFEFISKYKKTGDITNMSIINDNVIFETKAESRINDMDISALYKDGIIRTGFIGNDGKVKYMFVKGIEDADRFNNIVRTHISRLENELQSIKILDDDTATEKSSWYLQTELDHYKGLLDDPFSGDLKDLIQKTLMAENERLTEYMTHFEFDESIQKFKTKFQDPKLKTPNTQLAQEIADAIKSVADENADLVLSLSKFPVGYTGDVDKIYNDFLESKDLNRIAVANAEIDKLSIDSKVKDMLKISAIDDPLSSGKVSDMNELHNISVKKKLSAIQNNIPEIISTLKVHSSKLTAKSRIADGLKVKSLTGEEKNIINLLDNGLKRLDQYDRDIVELDRQYEQEYKNYVNEGPATSYTIEDNILGIHPGNVKAHVDYDRYSEFEKMKKALDAYKPKKTEATLVEEFAQRSIYGPSIIYARSGERSDPGKRLGMFNAKGIVGQKIMDIESLVPVLKEQGIAPKVMFIPEVKTGGKTWRDGSVFVSSKIYKVIKSLMGGTKGVNSLGDAFNKFNLTPIDTGDSEMMKMLGIKWTDIDDERIIIPYSTQKVLGLAMEDFINKHSSVVSSNDFSYRTFATDEANEKMFTALLQNFYTHGLVTTEAQRVSSPDQSASVDVVNRFALNNDAADLIASIKELSEETTFSDHIKSFQDYDDFENNIKKVLYGKIKKAGTNQRAVSLTDSDNHIDTYDRSKPLLFDKYSLTADINIKDNFNTNMDMITKIGLDQVISLYKMTVRKNAKDNELRDQVDHKETLAYLKTIYEGDNINQFKMGGEHYERVMSFLAKNKIFGHVKHDGQDLYFAKLTHFPSLIKGASSLNLIAGFIPNSDEIQVSKSFEKKANMDFDGDNIQLESVGNLLSQYDTHYRDIADLTGIEYKDGMSPAEKLHMYNTAASIEMLNYRDIEFKEPEDRFEPSHFADQKGVVGAINNEIFLNHTYQLYQMLYYKNRIKDLYKDSSTYSQFTEKVKGLGSRQLNDLNDTSWAILTVDGDKSTGHGSIQKISLSKTDIKRGDKTYNSFTGISRTNDGELIHYVGFVERDKSGPGYKIVDLSSHKNFKHGQTSAEKIAQNIKSSSGNNIYDQYAQGLLTSIDGYDLSINDVVKRVKALDNSKFRISDIAAVYRAVDRAATGNVKTLGASAYMLSQGGKLIPNLTRNIVASSVVNFKNFDYDESGKFRPYSQIYALAEGNFKRDLEQDINLAKTSLEKKRVKITDEFVGSIAKTLRKHHDGYNGLTYDEYKDIVSMMKSKEDVPFNQISKSLRYYDKIKGLFTDIISKNKDDYTLKTAPIHLTRFAAFATAIEQFSAKMITPDSFKKLGLSAQEESLRNILVDESGLPRQDEATGAVYIREFYKLFGDFKSLGYSYGGIDNDMDGKFMSTAGLALAKYRKALKLPAISNPIKAYTEDGFYELVRVMYNVTNKQHGQNSLTKEDIKSMMEKAGISVKEGVSNYGSALQELGYSNILTLNSGTRVTPSDYKDFNNQLNKKFDLGKSEDKVWILADSKTGNVLNVDNLYMKIKEHLGKVSSKVDERNRVQYDFNRRNSKALFTAVVNSLQPHNIDAYTYRAKGLSFKVTEELTKNIDENLYPKFTKEAIETYFQESLHNRGNIAPDQLDTNARSVKEVDHNEGDC